MAQHDWNAHYANDQTPWDTGQPDPSLVEAVRAGILSPGRTLEVGCGTGTNSVWLCEQGFDVVGVDLSPLAIEKARAKAQEHGTDDCRFDVVDFLADKPERGPFDVVFDRGCFHTFDKAETRARFAAQVSDLLAPGGVWLSLIGSTEGPARDIGPPRRSARDVVAAIEPVLEVIELRTGHFQLDPDLDLESLPMTWFCLARRRDVPAQPSTLREQPA